jgi:small subunit ribosomal protein S20
LTIRRAAAKGRASRAGGLCVVAAILHEIQGSILLTECPKAERRTDMANTPQARKRIRRNDKRAEINGARIGRIRTFVKKVESAIAGGDKSEAAEALKAAQPELARGVARGVLHKNTAARKMSRLTKAVSGL